MPGAEHEAEDARTGGRRAGDDRAAAPTRRWRRSRWRRAAPTATGCSRRYMIAADARSPSYTVRAMSMQPPRRRATRRFGGCRRWTRCSRRPPCAALLERAPRWAVVAAVRGEIERLRAAIVGRARRPRSTSTPAAARGEVDRAAAAVAAAGDQRDRRGAAHEPRARAARRGRGRARGGESRAATRTSSTTSTRGGAARATSTCADAAARAHRRRGRARGQQQRRRGAAGAVALASGREVIVSRGELVEIGGSFRVPDVMRAVGARARRGRHHQQHARARLRARDRRRHGALAQGASLELRDRRLHRPRSTPRELAESAHARGLPTMIDLGSGALVDLRALGARRRASRRCRELVRGGRRPRHLLAATSCSAARRPASSSARARAIDAVRAHPLMRALRPDKLTLAALEATLALYRDGRAVARSRRCAMLATPRADAARRARASSPGCARWRRRRSTSCPRACARRSAAARCRGASRGRGRWP